MASEGERSAARYYEAYREYLRLVSGTDASDETASRGVHGVANSDVAVVPPVWVGYSSGGGTGFCGVGDVSPRVESHAHVCDDGDVQTSGSECDGGDRVQGCSAEQFGRGGSDVSVAKMGESRVQHLVRQDVDGRDCALSSRSVSGSDLIESKRGPNWLRNVKNRAEQKARKAKRKSMGVDWRKRDGGDIVKQDDAPGAFWNSTSKEVRQQLIDSKAKMHIAENERREREARDKIAYYDSPESAMHKAVAMIEYAQKQAKKDKDSKVYGWAHTVASASAESLARSTPDSVPSFDELSAKLEASSQSSFELEIKAKQDELDVMEVELKAAKADARIARNMAAANLKHSEGQVAKEKHEAVVKRMRELELQKRNFEETESKMLFRVQKQERQRLHEEFGILT